MTSWWATTSWSLLNSFTQTPTCFTAPAGMHSCLFWFNLSFTSLLRCIQSKSLHVLLFRKPILKPCGVVFVYLFVILPAPWRKHWGRWISLYFSPFCLAGHSFLQTFWTKLSVFSEDQMLQDFNFTTHFNKSMYVLWVFVVFVLNFVFI